MAIIPLLQRIKQLSAEWQLISECLIQPWLSDWEIWGYLRSQYPWVHFQWVKSGRCFAMRLQTQVAPEIQKRLLLSRVEAESLKERDILCPTCGFRIQRVFSDATGHLSVKCQKCKNVHILNLAYFRRIRRNGYGRNCRRWRLQVNIETISNRVSGDKQFIC